MYLRAAILAYSTGLAAGAAGSFFVGRTIWYRAQAQGDAADRVYVLRGAYGRSFYRNLTYVAATRARRECTFVMPDLPAALVEDRPRDTAARLGIGMNKKNKCNE